MKILVRRIAKREDYTIGHMYIMNDGKWEYMGIDTIEDRDRGLDQSMSEANIKALKVYKQTAIPTGTYNITLKVVSGVFLKRPKYNEFCGGRVPRLVNVKGFSGVLIHSGTDQNSTAGCIIVGQNKVVGKVINSWNTFKALYTRMKAAADRGEKLTITIE